MGRIKTYIRILEIDGSKGLEVGLKLYVHMYVYMYKLYVYMYVYKHICQCLMRDI